MTADQMPEVMRRPLVRGMGERVILWFFGGAGIAAVFYILLGPPMLMALKGARSLMWDERRCGQTVINTQEGPMDFAGCIMGKHVEPPKPTPAVTPAPAPEPEKKPEAKK